MAKRNREAWLSALVKGVAPTMARKGYPVPENVRIACGWPSSGATSRNRTVGQCWNESASADGVHEIFISPTEADPMRVADIVVHELLHAILPHGTGHSAPFARAARACDLGGKPTATVATPELVAWLKPIVDKLGPYPHGAIAPRPKIKKGSRLLKVACVDCGYIARVTRTWLDSTGAPLCPCNEEPMEEAV